MSEYIGEHVPIREAIVCVEKRKGVTMRLHSTLSDLASVYLWPEEHRGKEWVVAQTMCLEAMEAREIPSRRGRHS